jgi:hypothetical protein
VAWRGVGSCRFLYIYVFINASTNIQRGLKSINGSLDGELASYRAYNKYKIALFTRWSYSGNKTSKASSLSGRTAGVVKPLSRLQFIRKQMHYIYCSSAKHCFPCLIRPWSNFQISHLEKCLNALLHYLFSFCNSSAFCSNTYFPVLLICCAIACRGKWYFGIAWLLMQFCCTIMMSNQFRTCVSCLQYKPRYLGMNISVTRLYSQLYTIIIYRKFLFCNKIIQSVVLAAGIFIYPSCKHT